MLVRRTRSSTAGTLTSCAVVLLKIAREATDGIPIVKQILGTAVHIVQLADVRLHLLYKLFGILTSSRRHNTATQWSLTSR